jgi:hypothetical protein
VGECGLLSGRVNSPNRGVALFFGVHIVG